MHDPATPYTTLVLSRFLLLRARIWTRSIICSVCLFASTSALATDTDDDGLSDHDEINSAIGKEEITNPLMKDTDGDGKNDNEDDCPIQEEIGDDQDNDGCIDQLL